MQILCNLQLIKLPKLSDISEPDTQVIHSVSQCFLNIPWWMEVKKMVTGCMAYFSVGLSNAWELWTDSTCGRLQMWHVRVMSQTLSSSCSVTEPGWSLRLRLALRLGGGLGWDSVSDSDHTGDVAASSSSTSSCLVIRILMDQSINIAEVYMRYDTPFTQNLLAHQQQ